MFLSESTKKSRKCGVLDSFNDKSVTDSNCNSITGLKKDDFYSLVALLTSMRNSKNRTIIEAVVIFLTRLRHNLSYDALSSFLSFRNRQLIGHICNEVQKAFMSDIVPYNIGCENIDRNQLILRQSKLANILFPRSKVIIIADGTYAFHQKSSNNFYQRISFSGQKKTHLCKPFTICTTDGFILDFFGPYNGNLNDATIMKKIMKTETHFNNLLEKGDLFIVDRGFRDCKEFLKELGFFVEMPALMNKKEKQLSTLLANKTRIVTKLRWVVEAIHGIIKQKWKLLNWEIKNQSLINIKDLFQIAGSLHNLYGPKLGSNSEQNETFIERARNLSVENALLNY